jgi:photosystem II stability/assembly factor-like uncharacterized protein
VRRLRTLAAPLLLAAAMIILLSGPADARATGRAGGAPAADGAWQWQNPLPTGAELTGIARLPSGRTVITTASSTFLSTDDNGLTWRYPSVSGTSPTATFQAVGFLGDGDGWAVGAVRPTPDVLDAPGRSALSHDGFGLVARTTDGGSSWLQVAAVRGVGFVGVSFVGPERGWAVGSQADQGGDGVVFRTDDGGVTWRRQDLPPATLACLAVHFTDALHGCVVCEGDQSPDWGYFGAGRILYTQDGGLSWTVAYDSPDAQISALSFVGSQGWAIGRGGLILHTSDGGASWSVQEQYAWEDLTCVWAVDDQHVWAGGPTVVERTSDGGRHWFADEHPGAQAGIVFTDATHGWVIGDAGRIQSTDDGSTWRTLSAGVGEDLVDVVAETRSSVWALGEGGLVIQTSDGGQTWTQRCAGDARLYHPSYRTLTVRGRQVWIAGEEGQLRRTADRGRTWSSTTLGGIGDILDVAIADARVGWAVGTGGVLRTADGGAHWRRVTRCVASVVQCSGRQKAWVGNGTRVLRTTNGGRTWSFVRMPSTRIQLPDGSRRAPQLVMDMCFTDARHGWLVTSPFQVAGDRRSVPAGSSTRASSERRTAALVAQSPRTVYLIGQASVRRTTDGGLTWKKVGSIPGMVPWSIQFTGRGSGWVAGQLSEFAASSGWAEPLLRHTADGGATWTAVRPIVPWISGEGGTWSYAFVDGSAGWAVGPAGRIAHTSTGALPAP